jgi:hypothetical protein
VIDLLTAAHRMMLTDSPLLDLLGSGPQSPLNPLPSWDHWLFSDTPKIRIENTQKSMIVLTYAGGWASPNPHNTMSFPRLSVDVWSDPTRSSDGSVKLDDAKNKILQTFAQVDRLLHIVKNSMPDPVNPGHSMPLMWGSPEDLEKHEGLRINGSQALDSQPALSPVSKGNGAWMGRKYYGISL